VRRTFLSAAVSLLFGGLVWFDGLVAGTSGKISGKVWDKETGKPLPGVNVIISGTTLGAATDDRGNYFILQVPPGNYQVKATMIGYKALVQENVLVSVDRTTRVDFPLEPTVLEMEKPIIVTAERPMVELDVTASARHLSTEEVKHIPNMVSFADVVAIQPGAVGSGRHIHIRGGRSGEVAYVVDGIPVRNPITGGSALDVDINSIQEIDILTGGYNAEYGSAQSAVVNIITKEGGEDYHGQLIYRTDKLSWGGNFNSDYGYLSLSGPEPISSTLSKLLGVSSPEATFFIDGSGDLTDTYLHMKARYPENKLLGVSYNDRQNNRYGRTAKLSYKIKEGLTLKFVHHLSEHRWKDYDWRWKDLPDSTNYNRRKTSHTTFTLTHTLSPKTFYILNLGYTHSRYKTDVHGLTPPDCWHWKIQNIDTITYDTTWVYVGRAWGWDMDGDGFNDRGLYQYWSKDESKVWTGKLDLTSQVHRAHQIKGGVEFNYKHVNYANIQYGGAFLTKYGRYVILGEDSTSPPPGPFPEYGLYRWVFDDKPYDGALYLQDKVEYEGLIINAGARIDFFSPGKKVKKSDYVRQWESVTGIPLKVKGLRTHFSPRLGIGYPITDRAKLYLSYGHFIQMPDLQYLYRDPWTGTWVGNPNLDPQINVQYEFGVAHQFTNTMAVDLKSFTKDISGYPGLLMTGSPPVWVWVNKGFASCRGIELELRKRPSHYVSGSANYTYMWSRGYASDSFMEYYRGSNVPPPVRENRLDWDRTHSVNLNIDFYIPKGEGPKLLGGRLDQCGINLLWKWGTGLPYTPFRSGGKFTLVENTATAPSMSKVDLKFFKDFSGFGLNYSLFLDILNLFDSRNVSKYYGFNTATGKPYKYGDADPAEHRIYDWREMKAMRDPRAFGPGRQIQAGVKLWW